jgi:hypothetical protein
MTKQEQIKQYNNLYPNFNITAIKRLTTDQIESYIKYGKRSLNDLYKTYSDAKRNSYNDILATYKPNAILAVQGSGFTYSVLLVAWNGDKLLITKCNNYLVKEV